MKKILVFGFILFSILSKAQTNLYYRVKIKTNMEGLTLLAKQGVAVDHGEYKANEYFIGEFDSQELAQIKANGFDYEILISDLETYYANQNNDAAKLQAVNSIACSHCTDYTTPSNFALGSMGGFFTYQEMLDILDSMHAKYPNLISAKQVISSTNTWEGRPIYYVKITDNPTVNESEPQVLYTSLHHAREAESLSQLIFYMWYLLENYNSNAEIQYLLNNTELNFIPCVNPDGYVYNQTTNPNGGGLWRKNRRNNGDGTFGVDLNRNYGFTWGYDNTGSSPTTNTNTYRGPNEFSEPETQAVRDFVNSNQFVFALNNHTYSNMLIYPWGHVYDSLCPDSSSFTAFAQRMTECSGFKYGTADQTVGYVANGDSDDWMYGEQTTKPKILAMTPEAGDAADGFWPVSTRIIPIAKNTMEQNLYCARVVAAYAHVKSLEPKIITSANGYLKYNIHRVGLQSSTFTVSIIPIGAPFQSIGAANVYPNLNHLESKTDSIAYTISPSLSNGTLVQYILQVNNGFYDSMDTISFYYGTPSLAFNDNCNNTSNWVVGTWGLSTTQFTSATGSITDSPTGMYANNANKNITTTNNINLSNATAAILEFNAKWDLEKLYDYVEIQISTNGTTYTPLCGKYTSIGTSSQDNGKPLFDGTQLNWVSEEIDISSYVGNNIKLRFKLVSDGGTTADGFYFDDLKVKVFTNTIGLNENTVTPIQLIAMPNPSNGITNINYSLAKTAQSAKLSVYDVYGKLVLEDRLAKDSNLYNLNLSQWANGIYIVRILDNTGNSNQIKIEVIK